MPLQFRNILPEHARICAVLDSLCFNDNIFNEAMLTSLLNTPYVFGFIALTEEKEDTPIGYSLVSIAGSQADLLTISILPEKQGLGYGRELLQKTIGKCAEKKVKELFLEVRPSNTHAIQLYESFGGQKIATRKNYYHTSATGEKEDALVIKIHV